MYHFGNGTTLSATDSTGGNNGTLYNGPTASAGKINGAAHFVHNSSQAIALTNPLDFPITTAWTMETWVKPSTDGNAVLAWGGTSNNGPHMILPGNNTWRVGFWGGASVDGTGVDTSAFHHIAGTFDGSNLRLYKDGALIAGPIAASPATASNPSAAIATSFGGFFFDGDVDELRISNTNRSANWVAAEYSNQNSPGTFIAMGGESCPSGTPTPTPTATPTATATPTPTSTPTPPFGADNFNRADGGLGLNWAKPVPASEQTLVIVNNEVTPDIEERALLRILDGKHVQPGSVFPGADEQCGAMERRDCAGAGQQSTDSIWPLYLGPMTTAFICERTGFIMPWPRAVPRRGWLVISSGWRRSGPTRFN